jgi:hypothetical protein
MLQRLGFLPVLALSSLLLATPVASAQHLINLEDFEGYNLGSLDKNDPVGTNMAPNGSGNPWFGPEFGGHNLEVTGPETDLYGNMVQPVSGSQMVRAAAPGDIDQDWLNIAYRFNGGNPFTGNIILSWWFFDPLGPGGTDYQDYIALGYYDTAPPDTDAPPGYNLNAGFMDIQRLSLGASPNNGQDANYYQARVVFATDGYNSNGWFNTPVQRSVGWHHAAIHVGPRKADGTNTLSFFIDDGVNPVLVHNSITHFGYNVIEMNAGFARGTSNATAYYDNIALYRGARHTVARIFGQ